MREIIVLNYLGSATEALRCLAVVMAIWAAPRARADVVYAWGYNDVGQIGDGTITTRNQPVAVSGLADGVTAVAVNRHGSLALQNGAVLHVGNEPG